MKHIVTLVCCFLVVLFVDAYGNKSIHNPPAVLGVEDCTNGIDDDGDGKIDHLDSDCICQGAAGKNYVPNSDFESYKECCYEISHDDCFNKWRSIAGTPDDDGPCGPSGDFLIMNIYPNPASGIAQVILNIEKSGEYSLNVKDISGHQIFNVLNDETLDKGQYTFELNLPKKGLFIVQYTDKTGNHISKKILNF